MVEDIVFIILVILAIGAGVWVWHMEVSGTPIVPQKSSSDAADTVQDNPSSDEDKETA